VPFNDDPLLVEPCGDKRWTLHTPLDYVGETQRFRVPAGYVTDFASVPRVVVALIPSFGRYTRSAILHDWLLTDGLELGLVSSVDADGLFRRSMRERGVPGVKRWLMWTGVRWAAVFSPRRRPGWWSTFWPVLGVSVLAVVPVLLLAVVTAAILALYAVAELIVTRGQKSGTLST